MFCCLLCVRLKVCLRFKIRSRNHRKTDVYKYTILELFNTVIQFAFPSIFAPFHFWIFDSNIYDSQLANQQTKHGKANSMLFPYYQVVKSRKRKKIYTHTPIQGAKSQARSKYINTCRYTIFPYVPEIL